MPMPVRPKRYPEALALRPVYTPFLPDSSAGCADRYLARPDCRTANKNSGSDTSHIKDRSELVDSWIFVSAKMPMISTHYDIRCGSQSEESIH